MQSKTLNRRTFLQHGTLTLAAAGLISAGAAEAADDAEPQRLVRLALLTDLHYADKAPAGTRHYRDTLAKLAAAGEQLEQEQPDAVVELGDLIDAADTVETELRYLRRIQREFTQLPGAKHYVLGNHCVDTLTKEEFLGEVGQEKSFYAFDQGGVHFVVLDACFRADGAPYGRKNFKWTDALIPPAELEWLEADLAKAERPTIVFAHQRLDVDNHYGPKNSAAVRRVLEQSRRVQAVFQGHSHHNAYQRIGGVHYCTLAAMIEGAGLANNSFATLDLFNNGVIQLHGFHKQQSRRWT